MVKIHKNLFNYKNDVSMLMQVHDELVFEIKENSIDKYSKIIKKLWSMLIYQKFVER